MIVSFLVYFKIPVTANEGLAKLREAVDNNRKFGNFTVETLKIIQQVNPTTAASTEGATSTVRIPSQKGDLTVKKDLLGRFCNHDVDSNKNVNRLNKQKHLLYTPKHFFAQFFSNNAGPCEISWSNFFFIEYVYVVVQFNPWFKFSFLLFLGMVMYDNNMIMSLMQKKRKFEPRIKLNHNIYIKDRREIFLSYS